MSSNTTQPEANANAEAANPLAKADAALAKARTAKPAKTGMVTPRNAVTAAEVVEKLEARTPPASSEPDDRTNRVVEVVLEPATKAKADLATVEKLLAEAYAVLPKTTVEVSVTLTSKQANVVADALALYSEFAPNLGTDNANRVHDAAVFTAFWIVRKAMLAANAHRQSHVATARQQHAVELGLTEEFPTASAVAEESPPDVGVDALTFGKPAPVAADPKPAAQPKKAAPKAKAKPEAKPEPAKAG